jgi:chemotaxis signal transduction protein
MTSDRTLQGSRRLAVLFRAAGTLFALPATAVREVVADPGGQLPGAPTLKGRGAAESLSRLLGETTANDEKAVALVLDSVPERVFLVAAVDEVADVSAGSFLTLPRRGSPSCPGLVRGALMSADRVALEIEPSVLLSLEEPLVPRAAPEPPPQGGRPPADPGRALVFAIGGSLLVGAELSVVTGVASPRSCCRVPAAPFGCVGLVHHERSLLPVFDLSQVMGGERTDRSCVAILEISGAPLGVAAVSVIGMQDGFTFVDCEPGGTRYRARDGRDVFFPDFGGWFPT